MPTYLSLWLEILKDVKDNRLKHLQKSSLSQKPHFMPFQKLHFAFFELEKFAGMDFRGSALSAVKGEFNYAFSTRNCEIHDLIIRRNFLPIGHIIIVVTRP